MIGEGTDLEWIELDEPRFSIAEELAYYTVTLIGDEQGVGATFWRVPRGHYLVPPGRQPAGWIGPGARTSVLARFEAASSPISFGVGLFGEIHGVVESDSRTNTTGISSALSYPVRAWAVAWSSTHAGFAALPGFARGGGDYDVTIPLARGTDLTINFPTPSYTRPLLRPSRIGFAFALDAWSANASSVRLHPDAGEVQVVGGMVGFWERAPAYQVWTTQSGTIRQPTPPIWLPVGREGSMDLMELTDVNSLTDVSWPSWASTREITLSRPEDDEPLLDWRIWYGADHAQNADDLPRIENLLIRPGKVYQFLATAISDDQQSSAAGRLRLPLEACTDPGVLVGSWLVDDLMLEDCPLGRLELHIGPCGEVEVDFEQSDNGGTESAVLTLGPPITVNSVTLSFVMGGGSTQILAVTGDRLEISAAPGVLRAVRAQSWDNAWRGSPLVGAWRSTRRARTYMEAELGRVVATDDLTENRRSIVIDSHGRLRENSELGLVGEAMIRSDGGITWRSGLCDTVTGGSATLDGETLSLEISRLEPDARDLDGDGDTVEMLEVRTITLAERGPDPLVPVPPR